MKQYLFSAVVAGSCVLSACSSDPPPAQPIAGTAPGPIVATAGTTGMMMGAVTAAGQGAIAGVAGMSAAGVGAVAAGMPAVPTPAAGVGAPAAGVGAAGAGAAGMPATGAVAGAGAAGMGAGGAAAFIPGSPTWSAIFEEIVVGTGCNGGTTCHTSPAAGQLRMNSKDEAYTALVGVKAAGINLIMNGTPNCKDSMLTRVVAGDPASSLLYDKLASAMPKCGGKMPPSAMLPANQVEQVRTWIMNGAKND